jgi:hypothetical protein
VQNNFPLKLENYLIFDVKNTCGSQLVDGSVKFATGDKGDIKLLPVITKGFVYVITNY